MTPTLTISQKLVNRLPKEQSFSSGYVYGIITKKQITILGLQLELNDALLQSDALPADLFICGYINIGDGNYKKQSIINKFSDIYVTDNPIFLNYLTDTGEIEAYLFLNEKFEKLDWSIITEQNILSKYLYLRLYASIPLTCHLNNSFIKEWFADLRTEVVSGAMSFNLDNTNLYLMQEEGENKVIGLSGETTVGELAIQSNEFSEGGGRKKKIQLYEIEVIKVNMLKIMTRNGQENCRKHAPLCVFDKKQSKTINISIPVDSLALVNRDSKINDLYGIIVESIIRNLRLLENAIMNSLEISNNSLLQPEVFHFYPEDCGHFFTQIYFKNDTEESLTPTRRGLHRQLLFNENRPIFRRSNAFKFNSKTNGNEPLVNPHVTVKNPENGGLISLVKGKYAYYHYCQNKMDDDGWGCAYRSLQTLASWFKLQGYTDKEVPTFKEIQKCLVDIGDKPSNFIDSKQWIGSTEVNFVLNTLFEVTSKILYVSSGEEMATKGPELVDHFQNQGSPIMIGGGVLAHTILGVDYNSESGNIKFLILDPHYTGSEDLHVIQSKGWCGWKTVDFWNKTAYYNLCLPQVPKCI